jgi:hypothetical protein
MNYMFKLGALWSLNNMKNKFSMNRNNILVYINKKQWGYTYSILGGEASTYKYKWPSVNKW